MVKQRFLIITQDMDEVVSLDIIKANNRYDVIEDIENYDCSICILNKEEVERIKKIKL